MPEVVQPDRPIQSSPPQAPARKNGPRGEVTIHPTWCKGCHICVDFCPQKVLSLDANGEHAIVAHPEKCTACHFCDTHCPDLAIVVRKLE